MATFPALNPSSRSFTPGRHPHSEIPALDGLQRRVQTSNVILDQRLRLTFLGLTETQMLSIRSHYLDQQGRFLSFSIPNELLSGMTTLSDFTPSGYSWIYAGTPQIKDISGTQRYTVNVELVTIPFEGSNINGAEFTVSVQFVTVTPMAITVAIAFAAGVPSVESAGLDIAVTASLEAGAASGA